MDDWTKSAKARSEVAATYLVEAKSCRFSPLRVICLVFRNGIDDTRDRCRSRVLRGLRCLLVIGAIVGRHRVCRCDGRNAVMIIVGGAHLLGSRRAMTERPHRTRSAHFIDGVGNLDSLSELDDVNLLERVGVHLQQDVTGDLMFCINESECVAE